jgi:uncharacterized FAD-dependent dehydrogenase
VAVGRYGRKWWRQTLRSLGAVHRSPTASVGVRFEMPSRYTQTLSTIHSDFKATIRVGANKIKTFCFCAGPGGGQIKFTDYGDYTLLDGHVTPQRGFEASNFALLAQLFDEQGASVDEHWIEQHIIGPYKALRTDRPTRQAGDAGLWRLPEQDTDLSKPG